MKKLLILGGNRQIGKRLIEVLFNQNNTAQYEVFTFNRGNRTFDMLPTTHQIKGDRKTNDIKQIFQMDWDIILDCSCYEPFSLKEITEGLLGKVGRYILISTISVYQNETQSADYQEKNELSELKKFTEVQLQSEGLLHYAEKKVAAENVLLESKLEDKIILRPHFIYGKYDYQNLDFYWLERIGQYNQVLIPNDGKDLIHRTYLEDLVKILLWSFETTKHRIIYNATTEEPQSLRTYLNMACQLLDKKVDFVSAKNDVLIQNEVRPIYDLPFWNNDFCSVFSNDKLRNDANLIFTPLAKSMEEVLNLTNPNAHWLQGKLGLAREKEEKLIKTIF
jgi:2'-hydroxyisoflavone reductase